MQRLRNIFSTKWRIGLVSIAGLILTMGLLLYINNSGDPLPPSIKKQVSFKVSYPKSSQSKIDNSSFQYQPSQKLLSYNIKYAGEVITVNQQPAPDNLGTDIQDYYPTLGIHPYAQFKTDAGVVALTKFWQSGSLEPAGQAAIMISNGTLLTAHTDKSLSNQAWKSLFETLKQTK